MESAKSPRRLKVWKFVLAVCLAAVIIALLPRRTSHDGVRATPRLTLLCDFLPTYVFTRNVVRQAPDIRIELLIAKQTGCPHDYSLKPEDLTLASQANAIIANGLGLDPFLDGLQKANPNARVITISDNCELLPAAGQHEHEAETHPAQTAPSVDREEAREGHHHEHEHEHGHEADANAHVWASPTQAIRQVRTLARKLAEIDPPNADQYLANADAYAARLQTLLDEMRAAAAGFHNRNIVTFHDAFAYLARDLDLNVVATLTQDPEYSPSAREVADVIDTIKRTHAAAIFYEPAYSDRLARTIGRDANVPVYALNPVNYTTGTIAPTTYEDIMRENLRVLQQALGGPR